MSNAAPMLPKTTVAEYLVFEASALEKYAYFQGEAFAMAGAGRRQNLLALNVAAELRQRLMAKPYETYMSDMRVHLQKLSTEVDLSVVDCQLSLQSIYARISFPEQRSM